MRMRKRHNLAPRMEKCADLMIPDCTAHRGRWLEGIPGFERLYVELGCGKGRFTADTAAEMPGTLLLAVEKVPDAMIIAMERIRERGLANVRFIDGDAAALPQMLAPGEAARIYINFCDPWPKSRDAKLRLTAPAFLRMYADALPLGGEIHFKNLHKDGAVGVMTDYEAKFYAEGLKINRVVARKTAATLGTAAGAVPRLRNASLNDARGVEESREANKTEENAK